MKIAALDLGSGTTKLSVFEKQGGGWQPLLLEELNTELRAGMGAQNILQAGPVAASVEAAKALRGRALGLGLAKLPAYGTSALRKARNPEALTAPLKALGIEVRVLNIEEEGRLNLLGALRGAGRPQGPPPQIVSIDPGGDSTDCAWGPDWRTAQTASLPFGSVSLLERFAPATEKTRPVPFSVMDLVAEGVKQDLDGFAPAGPLKGSGLSPAIRMNAPIAAALALAADGPKARYHIDELRSLTYEMAGMTHEEREELIAGEPMGKADRTPYGFASWIGILEWMGAEEFGVEPLGIKLGAALWLNGEDA